MSKWVRSNKQTHTDCGAPCISERESIQSFADFTVAPMATETLIVEKSRKDDSGNITAICGGTWTHTAATVITNIKAETHEYRVLHSDGSEVRPYGDGFLRSEKDGVLDNNLDNLPDC